MTFEEFDKSYDSLIEETIKMRDTKGKEYAHEGDRFANFKRHGEAIGLDPIMVLYVYASKHWDAITSYVKGNRTGLSEPIRGRIVDLITYAGLLNGMIEENTRTEFISEAVTVVPKDIAPFSVRRPWVRINQCKNVYAGKRCKLVKNHLGKHKR